MWPTICLYGVLIFAWKVGVLEPQLLPMQSNGMSSDACVDQALQRWYGPASSRFSQFAGFTLSMPSSRNLYENLFTQSFTTQSFKDYCKNYYTGRSAYERCAPSAQKTAALAGYGLADYICIQRLEDFANSLPCLQNAMPITISTCIPQCSQYEQASRMNLNPQPGVDSTTYMAGDCRYLKCMADCRSPQIMSQCGPTASALVQESLQNMILSLKKQYVSTPGRIGSATISMFPDECNAIANGMQYNTWNPMGNPNSILSNPYPGVSNPYPGSSNPYPGVSNPYPSSSNPYPGSSNSYPGVSYPYPSSPNPYPNLGSNPSFPNTGSNLYPNPNPYPNPSSAISNPNPPFGTRYWSATTRPSSDIGKIFLCVFLALCFRYLSIVYLFCIF